MQIPVKVRVDSPDSPSYQDEKYYNDRQERYKKEPEVEKNKIRIMHSDSSNDFLFLIISNPVVRSFPVMFQVRTTD